jgi:glycine/D-amino acid oxidase-like deaminating enzyme
MRVVICGGGVIGACTAYFLGRRGIDVIVVERTEVAAAASGKAGGFLALDWCAGSPLDALARRSFGLHATLRGEIRRLGYQRTTAYGGFVVPIAMRVAARRPSSIGCPTRSHRAAARHDRNNCDAAPPQFTAAVMSAAQQHGAELRRGRSSASPDARESTVTGVETDGGVIEADAVVVALGPWSLLAAAWMS